MSRPIDASTYQIIGGREEQQDIMLVVQHGDYTLAVIADGMGGHADGRGAALCAVQAFKDHVLAHLQGSSAPGLELPLQALHHADTTMQANQTGRRRSGTTLTGILTDGEVCAWAHVGDTRLWHVPSPSTARTITSASRIVTSDMHIPTIRNQLLSCLPLGADHAPPESGWFTLEAGDRLVLTSDGVHGGYQRDHDVWLRTPGRQDYWKDVTRGDGLVLVGSGDAQTVVAMGLSLSSTKAEHQDNASAIVLTVQEIP